MIYLSAVGFDVHWYSPTADDMQQAERCAADHTKYHVSAAVDIGNITQAAALFTDEVPPAALKARLKESQVELVLSGEEGILQ